MIQGFNISETTVSWTYDSKKIKMEKYKIGNAKYFEKEKLIVIFYKDIDYLYSYMVGYNIDGTIRFSFKSKDEFGINSFTNESGFNNIPVIGWVKEKGIYTDYYFDLDPEDGSLTRYGRAY